MGTVTKVAIRTQLRDVTRNTKCPHVKCMEDVYIDHDRGYASAYSTNNGNRFYRSENRKTGEWFLFNSTKHFVLVRGGIDVIGRMNIVYDGTSLVVPDPPESITLTEQFV